MKRCAANSKMGGYDLFHYSGHASHDGGEPDHSALFLRESAGSGSPMAMTAGELKSLLENSTLRFAYFSCCAGATQASEGELSHNDFLGIVDAAVQAGLPSVLGMRWPVSDRGARALATGLLRRVASQRGAGQRAAGSAPGNRPRRHHLDLASAGRAGMSLCTECLKTSSNGISMPPSSEDVIARA